MTRFRSARSLDTLGPYVAIQRARFSEWLTVDTDVDAEARLALMPPFVLQPLVENAIRHGLTPRGARHGWHQRDVERAELEHRRRRGCPFFHGNSPKYGCAIS